MSRILFFAVSLRSNSTSDWRLKRYQLIPHPGPASDGGFSHPKTYRRGPHGESTGDGQVPCDQQLTRCRLLQRRIAKTLGCLSRGGATAFGRRNFKQYQRNGSERSVANRVDDSNSTTAQPGPPPEATELSAGGNSQCEPFRDIIVEKCQAGLSARRIHQDLVADHGSDVSYWSVNRFVRALGATTELPFRRMEVLPGEELQVDFVTGAKIRNPEGTHRRTHVFRAVLSHSRKRTDEAQLLGCLANHDGHDRLRVEQIEIGDTMWENLATTLKLVFQYIRETRMDALPWQDLVLKKPTFAEIGGVVASNPESFTQFLKLYIFHKGDHRITSISFMDEPMTDRQLWSLHDERHSLPNLNRILLEDTKITDRGLSTIADLDQLSWILLDGTTVTDEGVAMLQGMELMQELGLAGTNVTNEGLKHLGPMTLLRTLMLSDTQVTDAGLVHLKNKPKLQMLTLRNTAITDAGLSCIAELTNLETLDLGATQISDVGLMQLVDLNNLKNVAVEGTAVTQEGVRQIRVCFRCVESRAILISETCWSSE